MRRNTSFRSLLLILLIVIIALLLIKAAQHSPRSTTPAPSPATTQQAAGQYPGSTAPELTSAHCHMRGVLPDPTCTPGVTNPAVTQATIDQTICVPGYTKTIRPPASYTDELKRQQMNDYGFTDSIRAHEEDHLISLELGGAPSDPKNLWPEPHASPNPKDKIEDELHSAVCDHRVTLQEAQQRIASDWTTAMQGL